MSYSYRNPWHPDGFGPAVYETDASPVALGKYLRFNRIPSNSRGSGCYDFVYDGVCFTQMAGPKTEEEIDADRHAQTNLARFCGVSFGPTWDAS